MLKMEGGEAPHKGMKAHRAQQEEWDLLSQQEHFSECKRDQLGTFLHQSSVGLTAGAGQAAGTAPARHWGHFGLGCLIKSMK